MEQNVDKNMSKEDRGSRREEGRRVEENLCKEQKVEDRMVDKVVGGLNVGQEN